MFKYVTISNDWDDCMLGGRECPKLQGIGEGLMTFPQLPVTGTS